MHFDNPTLFNLLLVQALASALVLSLLMMGWKARIPARWAQACMALQALGWLLLAGSSGAGLERPLSSLAMLAFSASLSALWWALRFWLTPRRGRTLMLALPVLLPLVYMLRFDDAAFRVAWAHGGLALQLGMVALSLVMPIRPPENGGIVGIGPGPFNRRWRALLLAAVLPLMLISLLRGGIAILGMPPLSPLTTEHINTSLALISHLSLMLALLGFVLAWRGDTEAELARLAQTDRLTGLADRRAFTERATHMLSSARRHHEPLALMLLDIDLFDAVNVAHGEEAGDRALALFSNCLQAQMRLGDLVARVGGEEFAVLMARCEAQGPQAMDKRLRETLSERAMNELGFALDFSAGWAKLRPGDRNIDDLMRRAETALYEAKRGGRSQLMAEPGLES
jgi:diguanylate cyclase (GGDEF)-like protein